MNYHQHLIRRWGYALILLTQATLAQEALDDPELEIFNTIFSEPQVLELLEPPDPDISALNTEIEGLRARLEQINAERDQAIGTLQNLRADVDVIHNAQVEAQSRATGLNTDLRAARARIVILENNLQETQEQEKTQRDAFNECQLQRTDAMDAARYCGENLVNSEQRARNAENQNAQLMQENSAYLEQLNNLKAQLAERENNLTQAQDRIQTHELTIQEMNQQLVQRAENIKNLQGQLQEQQNTLINTQNELAEYKNQLHQVQAQLQERDATLQITKLNLTQREENITNLHVQLQDRENALADAQKQINDRDATITTLQATLNNTTQERDTLQNRLTALEQNKTELQATLTKANQDWAELNAKHQNLDEHYQNLIITLAPIDGGTLDLKTAQDRAIEIYNTYRSLWDKHLRRIRDPSLVDQIKETRRNLFLAQYQVMRINGGGELYILRPNDSLSILAQLSYSDGSRIAEIRRANSHLLNNKAPLLVGTTLVVP